MPLFKKKVRLALRKTAARWFNTDRDAELVREYMARDGVKKLQIGCGRHILPGWLNADFYPKTSEVIHLDATHRLPFDDGTFDYVFSEHMIEHVPFHEGHQLIRECARVLAPGGTLRISTPDLGFLVDLYRAEDPPETNRSPIQEEYLQEFMDTEIEDREKHAPKDWDSFLINIFVRDWGHEFIYDEKTLRYVMEDSGLDEVVRCELMMSEHQALRDLEHITRKPSGHLALESFVLEATKPQV